MMSQAWLSMLGTRPLGGGNLKGRHVRAGTVVRGIDAGQISVVIPAYNAGAHLAATLQSVFGQTARPGEVIVVDDGSTDDTPDIARSFGVRLISLANGRVARARNAGTLAARGEYVAYMDADDLWPPQKLAVQLSALDAYPAPGFSFTDYRSFDERGVHEGTSGLLRLPAFRKTVKAVGKIRPSGHVLIADDGENPVLPDCYILPSSVLVRRADVLAVGGFDETVLVSEDFEFFLRLFKAVPAIAVMESLLLYRRHAAQQTANQIAFKSSVIDIAGRVARAPHRYPDGDVRYFAATDYVRYYRLGFEHARRERFDEATLWLERSLSARWTIRASLGLLATRVCRSSTGHRAFSLARTVWKRRKRTP